MTSMDNVEHLHLSRTQLEIMGGVVVVAIIAALVLNELGSVQAARDLDRLKPTPENVDQIEAHLFEARSEAESEKAAKYLREIGGKTAIKAYIASISSQRKPYAKAIIQELTAAGEIAIENPTQAPAARLLASLVAQRLVNGYIPFKTGSDSITEDRQKIAQAVVWWSFKLGDLKTGAYLAEKAAPDIKAAIALELAEQRQEPADYRQISGRVTKVTYAATHLK